VHGARTRGHPNALVAVEAMVRGRAPHAVLLTGPAGVGKTTLALDLAAGLLCTAAPAERPCRSCRACRLVEHDRHPDIHWLRPEGPGRQIVIGGKDSKFRGVRDLIVELAMLPVEGGARIAIIENADRMNEDAQGALLKTLEEPPAGATIMLCADAEEPLAPTIRSRCARLRLGPVAVRDIESILSDMGVADAPLAARLARISGGRPGIAAAWAAAPDALLIRDELVRTLVDLVDARPSERLATIRAAQARAMELIASRAPVIPEPVQADPTIEPDGPESDEEARVTKVSASDRRRAAEFLVDVWSALGRDLAIASRGVEGSVRELALLDDTSSLARSVDPATWTAALDSLGTAAVMLKGNVSPELVLDDLALSWPRRAIAAA